jgi:prepilin-type N-terminal cleavage/methylation domain-containing protein
MIKPSILASVGPDRTASFGIQTRVRTGAFTLLELLIATAIFAVILAAINTVFYGALRLQSKVTEKVDRSAWVAQVTAVIRRDLRAVMPAGSTLAGPIKLTGGSSDQQARLEIYCASGALGEIDPWGEVQKIEYYLLPSINATNAFSKDLIRAVTRNLLATTQPPPDEQLLLSGVAHVEFLCYDGTQWRNTWDSTTETTNAPTAFKFRIDLDSEPGFVQAKMPLELVVPVVMQSRTNSAATNATSNLQTP